MFGDLGKLGKIMNVVSDLKKKMPEMKEKLAAAEFTADAGGGVVRATVNGKGNLTDLKLSQELMDDGEMSLDMLEDLVKAAVSSAQAQAAKATEEAMKELTGGMDIPGLEGLL